MWETVEQSNISANVVKSVKSLYDDNSVTKYKVKHKLTGGIKISRESKQCCVSRELFNRCEGCVKPNAKAHNTLYVSFADDKYLEVKFTQDKSCCKYAIRKRNT